MIHLGDCREVMAGMDAESIDAVVADPPYGIGFMGHEWDQPGEFGSAHRGPAVPTGERFVGDHVYTTERSSSMHAGRYDLAPAAMLSFQRWCEAWAGEMLRIIKPGGHALVFGGTRTYHRMVAGLEDAGWEVRDCLVWAYASGFPKSLDISKAIDKAAGAEREVIGRKVGRGATPTHDLRSDGYTADRPNDFDASAITAPTTDDAKTWDGWGTALKPAWEPIVLVRKPFRGTVIRNVLTHGTGALNIDGTRIGIAEGQGGGRHGSSGFADGYRGDGFVASDVGRWPANLILTDPIFDGETPGVIGGGEQSGGGNPRWRSPDASAGQYGGFAGGEAGKVPVDTEGSYSRFFLIAKAARSEREPVIRGQLVKQAPPTWSSGEHPGTVQSRPTPPRENVHPTVKPVELMRHLIRLVTPKGGIVLDPFIGSGTTALAAEMEGFRWAGIEREPAYIAMAEARLNGVQRGLGLEDVS